MITEEDHPKIRLPALVPRQFCFCMLIPLNLRKSTYKNEFVGVLESEAKDFLNNPYERVEVLLRIHNMLEVWLLFRKIYFFREQISKIAIRDIS